MQLALAAPSDRRRRSSAAAYHTARLLLGLLFAIAGLSGFLLIANPPPPPPGLAGVFQHVFFESRWVLFVDGVELASGILLLFNRFVPLALAMLAAVIANIFAFHITMQPAGIPVAIVAALLWVIVSLRYKSVFAPLFTSQLKGDARE